MRNISIAFVSILSLGISFQSSLAEPGSPAATVWTYRPNETADVAVESCWFDGRRELRLGLDS